MMYKLYLILKFNNANVDDHTISLATAIWGQTEVPASSAELLKSVLIQNRSECRVQDVTSLVSFSTHWPQKRFPTSQLWQSTELGFAMAALPSCQTSQTSNTSKAFWGRVAKWFAKSFERKNKTKHCDHYFVFIKDTLRTRESFNGINAALWRSLHCP